MGTAHMILKSINDQYMLGIWIWVSVQLLKIRKKKIVFRLKLSEKQRWNAWEMKNELVNVCVCAVLIIEWRV